MSADRDEARRLLDTLRWVVVGGSLAAAVLLATAFVTWGTTRSYVAVLVAAPIVVAVVLAGRRLRR